jgi:O-acetyl-ADP-ribose deacetylase (regulator of RNase III)
VLQDALERIEIVQGDIVSCYRTSLRLAAEHGARSIALSAIRVCFGGDVRRAPAQARDEAR